jgi:hypothetical protein
MSVETNINLLKASVEKLRSSVVAELTESASGFFKLLKTRQAVRLLAKVHPLLNLLNHFRSKSLKSFLFDLVLNID